MRHLSQRPLGTQLAETAAESAGFGICSSFPQCVTVGQFLPLSVLPCALSTCEVGVTLTHTLTRLSVGWENWSLPQRVRVRTKRGSTGEVPGAEPGGRAAPDNAGQGRAFWGEEPAGTKPGKCRARAWGMVWQGQAGGDAPPQHWRGRPKEASRFKDKAEIPVLYSVGWREGGTGEVVRSYINN